MYAIRSYYGPTSVALSSTSRSIGSFPKNVREAASIPVSQGIANAVAALKGTQGNQGHNIGGWNYVAPGSDGDRNNFV